MVLYRSRYSKRYSFYCDVEFDLFLCYGQLCLYTILAIQRSHLNIRFHFSSIPFEVKSTSFNDCENNYMHVWIGSKGLNEFKVCHLIVAFDKRNWLKWGKIPKTFSGMTSCKSKLNNVTFGTKMPLRLEGSKPIQWWSIFKKVSLCL